MPRIEPDDSLPLPEIEGARFNMMTTLFRSMGQRPEIMQAAIALLQATMRSGTVDPALKELLAIRVSQVNQCFY